MPQNNPHKNKEGYSDPTAYEALRKIDEEDARFHRLLDTIFYLCELAGFRIEGRTARFSAHFWVLKSGLCPEKRGQRVILAEFLCPR